MNWVRLSCSHCSGRLSGGDLRAGQTDHRGLFGIVYLDPLQGEAVIGEVCSLPS